jgi:hypothetical protein
MHGFLFSRDIGRFLVLSHSQSTRVKGYIRHAWLCVLYGYWSFSGIEPFSVSRVKGHT